MARTKATPELLSELAQLVDASALSDFVDDLKRAREQKRSGSVSLEAELSFGTYTDGWSRTRLRPRRSAA